MLSFTNDGRPPHSGVRETGGLSNLRRMAEHIGGGMKIRSLPVFQLALILPKKTKENDYGISRSDRRRLSDDPADV